MSHLQKKNILVARRKGRFIWRRMGHKLQRNSGKNAPPFLYELY